MTKRTCFVIMSFDTKYDLVYAKSIRPAVEDLGISCKRIDDDSIPKNIPGSIIREIVDADLIIADVTEPNPNVFYELGISHTIGNKTIIITQDVGKLPFDVKGEYAIGYKDTQDGLQLLKFILNDTIEKLLAHPDDPSNLVQEAARYYFDIRGKIRENLARIVDDANRLQEFRKYLKRERRTNNSKTVQSLAAKVSRIDKTSTGTTVVSICGGAALGKTTVANQLKEAILQSRPDIRVGVLPTDSFIHA